MRLKDKIRTIPDFPGPGIRYRDITALLREPEAFKELVDAIAEPMKGKGIDIVLSPEARGFILGSAVAYALGAGFVPLRRPGRLPGNTRRYDFTYEAGTESLEMHEDALVRGQKALIVDDMLSTGATALATARLAEGLGADIAAMRFAIELTEVNGRETLNGYDVDAIIKF